MSRSWQHPLLWGHYADKHKGICLGFEVQDENFFEPVNYVDSRPTLKDFGCSSLSEIKESQMRQILFTKWDAWAYEEEYRAYVSLNESDPVTDLHFATFNPALKLTDIIVGQRCNITRKEVDLLTSKFDHPIRAFKTRSGFKGFEIVENQRRVSWK
jgi:hypothetical protein